MPTPSVTALQDALLLETLARHGCFEMVVRGGSMLPTLWQGDTVLLERVDDGAALQLSDVVLVVDDGFFAVHRLIGVRIDDGHRRWLLKGDAQAHADGWFDEAAVVAWVRRAMTTEQVPFVVGQRPLTRMDRMRLWRARRRRR